MSMKNRRLAHPRQRRQRLRRAERFVADAPDIDQHVIVGEGIDHALELADHAVAANARIAR
jgi:hypothetical protein